MLPLGHNQISGDSLMGLLLLFFLLSIGFSFLCSIWEAVLLSITPSYISAKTSEKAAVAEPLKKFKEDIDRPLSAILTLNTIAHTVGAIMVGVQAGKLYGQKAIPVGPLEISMESIIAGVMTLLILVLSEIIPKTLGANYWQQLTPFTVFSLRILLTVLAPFVWLSQLITKNLKSDKNKSVLSRADFSAMAQAGEDSGVLKEMESSTIKNLLRLDHIKVHSIMTPRTVMNTALIDEELRSYFEQNQELANSRIPVFDTEKEEIKGILLKDELLQALLDGHDTLTVSELMRPATFINGNDDLSKLQSLLMESRSHIAIVVDDYGAVIGLVTMEDLFETILGLEIVDETDNVEDLQKMAKEIWKKRSAKMNIGDN